MNTQRPQYFLAEAIPRFINIKFRHLVNNCGKYADGFFNSMINDKDSDITLPLIMLTCTTLRHALLEWQKNNGVHLKASQSKQKVDRPDHSNYFNYKNHGGKNASCCTATGRKLLTSSGIADTYTFLMNTWNTLLESYQQRVYKNTLATVKYQIQPAENPMPALVISLEAAHVDNAILLDYLTSEVALEKPEIRCTDPNIPIDNNCMDDELHFGMPGGMWITEMNVTNVTSAMPSPPSAGDDSPRLNSRGFTWEPVMSTGMRVRMGTIRIRMWMRRKKHRKLMMDQHQMWRAEGTVGSTCEQVMLMGMSAKMAPMQMRMRRKKHRRLMMDQNGMWRTEGIILESVKIGQYISDM